MKVLILGGSGMLGHKLWQACSVRFDTYVTLRRGFDFYSRYQLFDEGRSLTHVSAENFDSVIKTIDKVKPAVAVNCIGIVKQAEAARDPLMSIEVNSLFPHRLAQLCQSRGIRLIHISTDCVFSGHKGNYTEEDLSDAEDLYGKTKFLGEVSGEGCLTIRTSMIGRELETSYGLIEWLLSQEGKTVYGYKQSIFSGLTTNVLANTIVKIITDHVELHGVWHVASEPVSKLEVLNVVKQVYGLDIEIEPDETVIIDRSLSDEKFRKATGFISPSWHDMIGRMYEDTTPYSRLRRSSANR